MAQYLDNTGLQELVTKTKEYARKSAKEAVNPSAAGEGKTITGWNDATSAAIYSDIAITSGQVTDLAGAMALKADLDSPHFTGTPTVPYPTDTTTESSAVANVKYVLDTVGTLSEAMLYKGAVSQASDLPTADYKAGWTYKVAVAGSYAGQTCEVGDLIIANKDYKSGEASNADWDVIQTNIDGAVSGPATATSGAFVLFDGTTGKKIMNSEFSPSSFKRIQTSAAFNGNVLQTIQNIEQNANGDISVTYQDIQSATTSQKGVVQLQDTIGAAESEDGKAATPKSVRDAINALDVSDITGFGTDKTLSALSETDGKISATFQSIQIAESQVTDLVEDLGKIATSAANLDTKIDEVSGAVATSAAVLDAKITAVSGAVDNLDAVVTSTDGTNVQVKVTEVDGKITAVNITTDNTANKTDIDNAINTLDFGPYAIPESGTITSISETDGKISVTSGAIAITSAQVTDLGTVLGNYKTKQSAVSDPTASGDGITFIDSISQNANGEITPTKKTVQSASDSKAGLMSAADFTKLKGISTSANRVTVEGGVLSIDGTSAMGPISTIEIDNLFNEA